MEPSRPSRDDAAHWSSRPLVRMAPYLVVILAVLAALTAAWLLRWTCDDAYIGYRYAKNLAAGNGMVFNLGERVEGHTAFLWVSWIALGYLLKITPESWTIFWGLLFYVGSVGLLGVHSLRLRRRLPAASLALPLAALGGALHPDWSAFATSGIETSAFTFLLVLGYFLLTAGRLSVRRLFLAGLVFGMAGLTRADGPVLAACACLWVTWSRPLLPDRPLARRLARATLFGGACLLLWVPFLLWRISYYGDIFPNTYYAKSAALTWWSQGWHYVRLYFVQYWAHLLGMAAVLGYLLFRKPRSRAGEAAPAGHGGEGREWLTPPLLLACALALPYMVYVIRVGGDFMFARMFIPVVPFMLVIAELSLAPLASRRPVSYALLGLVLVISPLFSPRPVSAKFEETFGIADEWEYYTSVSPSAEADRRGNILRRYFSGLPVRMLIFGAEARLGYRADPEVLIEGGGLTDHFVAHQYLTTRGRVGHEKRASASYVIDRRGVHFMFHPLLFEEIGVADYAMRWPIKFDDVEGYVLTWDPKIMQEVKRRGAVVADFLPQLDDHIRQLSTLPRRQVAEEYLRLRRFYFDHVNDPARQRPFREALATH